MIELTGDPDANGMVMDYFDMKTIIEPIIDNFDHAFMVYENDFEVIEALEKLNSRKVVVEFETTAENICLYILKRIKNSELPKNVKAVKVRVMETDNSYAEEEILLI